jgi:ribosomal RNA-processing protein 1
MPSLSNQEVQPFRFCKELAANEKTTRDRAVRALSKRLGRSLHLSHLDLMKLWKGLFYCVWMSDKPLVQQELAQQLAAAIHCMPRDQELRYIEAFWCTMIREWYNIDRLRLDKYYMLIRKMLHEIFEYLKRRSWDNSSVESVSLLLEQRVLCGQEEKIIPESLQYFVAENFLQELRKFSDQPVPVLLLRPFTKVITLSSHPIYLKRVKNCIFDQLLEAYKLYKENKTTAKYPPLFGNDLESIRNILIELANQKEIQPRNYKCLRHIIQSYDRILCPSTTHQQVS